MGAKISRSHGKYLRRYGRYNVGILIKNITGNATCVELHVLTAMVTKSIIFWGTALCSNRHVNTRLLVLE
jgi:hypothetical protein